MANQQTRQYRKLGLSTSNGGSSTSGAPAMNVKAFASTKGECINSSGARAALGRKKWIGNPDACRKG